MKQLFQGGNVDCFLSLQRCKLIQELQALGPNYLLRMNEEDLCERLISKYYLQSPRLKPNDSYIYNEPTSATNMPRTDRSDSLSNASLDRSSEFICLAVPFEGDAKSFSYRPSEHNGDLPSGEVVGSKILLHLQLTEAPQDRSLQHNFKQIIEQVEDCLHEIKEDAIDYNNSLEPTICRNLAQMKINFRPPHEHAFVSTRRSRAATQGAR
ncbi:MAG: hypothetical protein H0T92_14305 [Pyrinomonadaceae bacterium]|jgi:hypothetical protein|nr:hypothetical protein [Pyrinomonadaceae bacterium]